MPKRIFLISSVALVLFVFDRLTKYLILKLPSFKGVFGWRFLDLTPSVNADLSFSLPFPNLLAGCLSAIIITCLIYFLIKNVSNKACWPLTLLIAGAFGNLIDRIKFGGVIDFISFFFWPSFNLADAYIALGAGWLILILRRSYSPALKTDSGSEARQEDSK